MTAYTSGRSERREPPPRIWNDDWDECPSCHMSREESEACIDGHWFSCVFMQRMDGAR